MKRPHAKLSFDDEDSQNSSGDERPLRAQVALRGLPGACQGTSSQSLDRAVSPKTYLEAKLQGVLQARTAVSTVPGPAGAPTSPEAEKFAWMDSDDNDDGGEDAGACDNISAQIISSEADDRATDGKFNGDALPSSMEDVRSFSEFVRLTPAIKKAVATFSADELVALCKTAARLKYFDGDLFEDVFRHIILRLKGSEFSVTQTTSIAVNLADLNAYNAQVFHAASLSLLPNVSKMPKAQRLQWIKLLALVNHNGDDAFVEALRLAPLLPEEEASGEDGFNMCWQFMNGGFCPRGTSCKWTHPAKKSGTTQPRKTK